MQQTQPIPVSNDSSEVMYVGKYRLAPGETRIFEAYEVPQHFHPSANTEEASHEDADPLLVLLDLSIPKLEKSLGGLSVDDLDQLEQAENNGNTRVGAIEALAKARLLLANRDLNDADSDGTDSDGMGSGDGDAGEGESHG